MSDTTDTTDLSNFCRLCLKSGENIRSIFVVNRAMTDFSQLIYDCTKIKVTVDDCTTAICILCYKEITNILTFRQRCVRANEQLKRLCQQGEGQDVKSTLISNQNLGNSEGEYIGLTPQTESDDEQNVIASKRLWEKSANFEEISDYEMPSPELCESDEQIGNSTSDDTRPKQSDVLGGKNNEIVNSSGQVLPKSRCKMKNDTRQSQKQSLEDWPKLKKRDLVETKAYRGLCHLCGKEYQHLWVHLQSHSEVPTETCDICGKGFRSKANLSLHILLHKEADMPCEVCGKKYRTKMRLKRHMRVHTQNRPFSCSLCQKRFYTKYNLEVHSRIHSGERPFSCSVKNCNERFAHSYALKHHMDKLHKQ